MANRHPDPPVVEPTGIEVNPTETRLAPGQTVQLTATIVPESSDQTASWTSADPSVATVSDSGFVTAEGVGTAIVSVTTVNGLTADTTVVVEMPEPLHVKPVQIYREGQFRQDIRLDGLIFSQTPETPEQVDMYRNAVWTMIPNSIARYSPGSRTVEIIRDVVGTFEMVATLSDGSNTTVKFDAAIGYTKINDYVPINATSIEILPNVYDLDEYDVIDEAEYGTTTNVQLRIPDNDDSVRVIPDSDVYEYRKWTIEPVGGLYTRVSYDIYYQNGTVSIQVFHEYGVEEEPEYDYPMPDPLVLRLTATTLSGLSDTVNLTISSDGTATTSRI